MALRIPIPDYFEPDAATAAGASAALLTGRDLRTGRDLAIKTYRAPSWMTTGEAARHRARIAAAQEPLLGLTDCPGLAPVRDIHDVDGILYVARDYVRGEPLSAALRNHGTLPLHEVHAFMARVAATIDRLSSVGISHSALTSDNVILADNGSIMVTDAAFARAARAFMMGNLRMTLNRRNSPEEDVRALAVLTYRALTGCEPPSTIANAGAIACNLQWSAREALRRALNGDRKAFRNATELAEAIWPEERPTIFRAVWRPAAAMGLLGALGTLGGTAISESAKNPGLAQHAAEQAIASKLQIQQGAAAESSAQVAATAPAAVPEAPLTVSQQEAESIRLGMRRRGAAVLSNPDVAALFQLTESQRQIIDLRCTEERLRVGRVVDAAANGKLQDTITPMSIIRSDTRASILRVLTPAQQALWDNLENAPAAPGEPAL